MANFEPRVIRANRFILEDEQGAPLAEVSVDSERGLVLSLYKEDGTPRVTVGVSSDELGAVLSLYGEDGKARMELSAFDDGAALSIYDDSENDLAMLSGGKCGGAGLTLFGEKGTRAKMHVDKWGTVLSLANKNCEDRVVLAMDEKDTPMLGMLDENGNDRAGLVVDKDGPMLRLWDKKSTVRAGLGVSEEGGGARLYLLDKNGKARLELAVGENGQPMLDMFDNHGETIFRQP